MVFYLTLHLFLGEIPQLGKGAEYQSKLPGNIKKHKAAAEQVSWTLDCDLIKKKKVLSYTDNTFH
jgi:hypothetical protein